MPQRIDISALLLRLERYGKHMGVLLQLCPHRLRQREMVHARLQHLAIVLRDTYFLQITIAQDMSVGLHEIVQLHALAVGFGNTVHIYHIIYDLQRVSRGAYAAFHVVLPPVHRAHYDITEDILALVHGALTVVVAEGVVIGVLHALADGIACGEVEDHDVAFLGRVPACKAFVAPLRAFYVTLAAAEPVGESVLHERHGERRVGHTRTVTHLAHAEEIAYAQALLQRTGRNLIVLENVLVDEIDCDERKEYRVHPRHDGRYYAVRMGIGLALCGFFFADGLILMPPIPRYVLCGEHIHDDG